MGAHENHIVKLRDVPIAPYLFRPPIFHGGIAADRVPDEGRMRQGKGFRDAPEPIEAAQRRRFFGGDRPALPRLEGRYLWGGPLWNHFGHFFVDCIHRLWALRDGGTSYDGVVFSAVQGLVGVRSSAELAAVQPPRYLAELMDLLDIPKVPVHMVRAPLLVDRLDVPAPGTAPRTPIRPFYRYWLDRYQESIETNAALHISRAPDRLYLGRSHLLHKGGVLGSSLIERELRRTGFYAATPEVTSLAHQMGHLLGGKIIVADEGSALHPTQVMSRIGGEVLMFPRREKNQIYSLALSERGRFASLADAAHIVALSDRFGSTSSPGGLALYREPQAVWRGLVERGLVEGDFDADAWHAAECRDLEAARPATEEVRQARAAALEKVRGRPALALAKRSV